MATYTNKTFNTATFDRKLGSGDPSTMDDVLETMDSGFMDYFTAPTVYTNKRAIFEDSFLLIDGTYNLLIDATYKLLAEEGQGPFTNKSRQSSVYTNKQIANAGTTEQELLIDDTYQLLIDSTYALDIQAETPSQVWTNKVRNN